MKPISPKIIYSLENPINGAVFYVGSSQDLEYRLRTHIGNPGKMVEPIINEITSKGLLPVIGELDRSTGDNAMDLEAFWINQMLSWGFPLVNISKTMRLAKRPATRKIFSYSGQGTVRVSIKEIRQWKKLRASGEPKGIKSSRLTNIMATGKCTPSERSKINRFYNVTT